MTESQDDDRPVTASSDTPASEGLPVLGDPDDDTTGDFATEHQETSVDDDEDRGPESPKGQSRRWRKHRPPKNRPA